MKSHSRMVLCLFALVVAAGCSKINILDRHEYEGETSGVLPIFGTMASLPRLPRCRPTLPLPVIIWSRRQTQTADQIEGSREVGAILSAQLAEDIRAMGLPAEQASVRANWKSTIL